jgi:hypothetical protein
MIKINPNIVVGSLNDLPNILNSVHYIINCSVNLNNLFVHQNYMNLNIHHFSIDSLQLLNSLFDFIKNKILLNHNIFLLCENGINNSLITGMFVAMKLYNLTYNEVYYKISIIYPIHSYDFYSGLKYYEPYIQDYNLSDEMDIS